MGLGQPIQPDCHVCRYPHRAARPLPHGALWPVQNARQAALRPMQRVKAFAEAGGGHLGIHFGFQPLGAPQMCPAGVTR